MSEFMNNAAVAAVLVCVILVPILFGAILRLNAEKRKLKAERERFLTLIRIARGGRK